MMNTETIEGKLLASRGAIVGYIRGKVGDAELAEDILQDSLLKALRSGADLRDDEKLIPWFYQIVNNAIIDLFRRRQTELRYLERAAGQAEQSVEPEEQKAICACINAIIPTLKPEYAELIEALDLRDADPGATAERLGITRNNLKVRLHRAHAQLRKRLQETCGVCARHGCLDCGCSRT